ncbi:MAG: hypothetical protein PF692_06575 [Kiritimatiellae bacterium]|jgi:hypothetical protein|nr:hypothetical protein [Kiritimatiellia bacterium]
MNTKLKNIITLLLIALFSFGVGFAACWFRIGISAREKFRDIPLLIFMSQNVRDLMVAEDIYFRESPEVALGAMLSYVQKMNEALDTGILDVYPDQEGRILHDLYIAHGRIAELYRKLSQQDKAEQHISQGLQLMSNKKWIDADKMRSDVENSDEWSQKQRKEQANK